MNSCYFHLKQHCPLMTIYILMMTSCALMGPKVVQLPYLLSSAVEDADEDGDDAVAAHELAVVGRGGHGLEGERHLLEVAAAQHGDQRVDALHLN